MSRREQVALEHAATVLALELAHLHSLAEAELRLGRDLVLSRYLESGRAYEAVTAALAIHRSTLKYRLRRVREISGHDLGDPDTCFNLQLAARAWHTLQALRDERS